MTNDLGQMQLSFQRIDGTLTPVYRHGMGPWLRCDQHARYVRSNWECTPGMGVWTQLMKQDGAVVLEGEIS